MAFAASVQGMINLISCATIHSNPRPAFHGQMEWCDQRERTEADFWGLILRPAFQVEFAELQIPATWSAPIDWSAARASSRNGRKRLPE
jgi:hypothetical protein